MDRSSIEILLSNLNKLSKHTGLSQTEIARRCGLAQKTVNNLFRSVISETSPKIDTIDKIARTFNLTAADLLSPDMSVTGPVKKITMSNPLPNTLGCLIEDFLHLDAMGQASVINAIKIEHERTQRALISSMDSSIIEERKKSGKCCS